MKINKRSLFQVDKLSLVLFGGMLIILLFIFKPLIIQGGAVWGDSPFFYPEGLKELFREPQIWVNRNHNFGGVELSLWLAPLMFLYGSLYKFFNLENGAIIKLLFYFPSLIFSVISPIIFARYLKLPTIVQFFTSLLYFTNTYFLLLIDGGKVGVTLAYSIFPVSLTFLLKLFNKPSVNSFYLALLFYFVLQVADARIALISIFAGILWVFAAAVLNKSLQGLRNLWILGPFGLALAGISSYWLIPLLTVSSGAPGILSSNSQSTLLDSFALFQPHWPLNQFGKISSPPPYFAGIPVLILSGLLYRRIDRKYWVAFVCFFIFAFLAKGNSKPLGGIYEWAVASVPFGVSFRDSTKFFIPLILLGGLLLGLGVNNISGLFKSKFYKLGVVLGVAVYLLIIIKPVWLGQLNGVLSGKKASGDFNNIYQKLSKDESFFRTVWFPEKSPFSFQTEDKPALDAKSLAQNRPFASLNTGNDPYNFFTKDDWTDYFRLLGIKYLVLSGDPREIDLTDDKKELEYVQGLIKETPGVEKVQWGTNFPIYEVSEVRPKIFATNKLLLVLGGEDVYSEVGSKQIVAQGLLFLDDGKTDPRFLDIVASESATLVFNKSDENDFLLSFLQKYFTSLKDVLTTQWAKRESSDYLSWKYELLQKGIDTHEFDYGKSIQFSTVPNEKTTMMVNAPTNGQYMLAIRSMSRELQSLLKLSFNKESVNIPYARAGRFEWYTKGPINLKKGNHELVLQNIDGIHVFNTAGLVPLGEWNKVSSDVRELITKFNKVVIDGSEKRKELSELVFNGKWTAVDHKMISPTKYKVSSISGYPWIIFTDSFNGNWKLIKGSESISSLPFYSMLNGFYIPKQMDNLGIVFKGQDQVRWGIYFSALSILSLIIIFLYT